jgi:acetyltransferase-like isoleucine patch superfamily enzyme
VAAGAAAIAARAMTDWPPPRRTCFRARRLLEIVAARSLGLDFVDNTRDTQTPITVGMWARQHLLGVNYGPYWPVHRTSTVVGWRNILAGVETSPGYMGGCYIQALGKIYIGDYTQIGPNVGVISANHDVYANHRHDPETVRIGAYCWLGMGATILPGVELGDFTSVGAGAVVTRSFASGYCLLAGNPARIVRELDRSKCVRNRSANEYHGYIAKADFAAFRARCLNV